ncbi:MAG: hypothetical protein V4604_05105 [Bacteroidota bacterium]
MSDIYFYTDPETLVNQLNNSSTGEAFGPVTQTKYQITNRHASSGSSKAIAVFDGIIVAVDPDPLENELVLILQPNKSTSEMTTLDLPNIKYVIYKGVKRSSIIDSSDSNMIAPSIANDLTCKIWENQDKNNLAFGTTDSPGIKSLRLGETILTDIDIDDLFKVNFNTNIQLTEVNAGDHIGDFLDGTAELFGVEFALDEVRCQIKYSEVQESSFCIDVSSDAGLTPIPIARIRHKKERILTFIDPTTFYGSLFPIRHKDQGKIIKIKRDNLEIDSFDGTLVYEKCLSSLYNKNRIYIDIRNELNNSFNLLDVYSSDLYLKLGRGDSFTARDYYSYFGEWPILGLDVLNGSSNAYDPETNRQNEIEVSLKLPNTLVKNDNKNPIVLVYSDYKKIGRNKVHKIQHHKKINKLKVDRSSPSNGDFFKELNFSIPNSIVGTTNNINSPISTYIRLKIFREDSKFSPDVTVHRPESYFDCLLLPFKYKRSYTEGLEIKTFKEDIYLGTDVDVNTVVFTDHNTPDTNFVSSVGYAFDDSNVTLFTFAQRRRSKRGDNSKRMARFNRFEYYPESKFLQKVSNKYSLEALSRDELLGSVDLDIPGNSGKIYRFKKTSDVSSDKDAVDLSREFSAILLKNASYAAMQEALTLGTTDIDPNYDVFIVLRNRDNIEAAHIEDPTSVHIYSTYEIHLRGFKEVDDGESVHAEEWNSGITVFSYSESKNGKVKNFLFVEEGVTLEGVGSDNYLPCRKTALTEDEVQDLKNFIERIKANALAVPIPSVPSSPPFKPNIDLYEKVFRDPLDPEPFYMTIDETTGKVYFKKKVGGVETPVLVLPNSQSKGFIFEAATIFAVWNIASLLSDEDEENYVYERLFRVLFNNGLNPDKVDNRARKYIKSRVFNPFHYFGGQYVYPDPIVRDHPTTGIGGGPGTIELNRFHPQENLIFRTTDTSYPITSNGFISVTSFFNTNAHLSNTSFRKELFNLIRGGNFDPLLLDSTGWIIEKRDKESHRKSLFDLPNKFFSPLPQQEIMDDTVYFAFPPASGGSGTTPFPEHADLLNQNKINLEVKKYIEPLLGHICKDIVGELKFLINRNASCYYRIFTESLNLDDKLIPQARMLATGEGSSTSGLTNAGKGTTIKLKHDFQLDTEEPQSFAAMLFTYDLDDTGVPKGTYIETFPTITTKEAVSIHLTIFGQDNGFAPDIVDVEIATLSEKNLMRFIGYNDGLEVNTMNTKLFPIHSHLTVPVGSVTYLNYAGGTVGATFYPGEKRVSLLPYGTSIFAVNGGSLDMPDPDNPNDPNITNSQIQFYDSKNKVVGSYFGEWNNLIIQKDEPYDITVRVYSGNSLANSVIDKVPYLNPAPAYSSDKLLAFDEIQVAVNIFESKPVDIVEVTVVELDADNLYSDDKFELKSAQKLALVEEFDEYKSAYKKLAKLLIAGKISPDNISISLNGYNIGRRESELSPESTSTKIIRDTRFAFASNRKRPKTYQDTLGDPTWSESFIDVGLPIDSMYHPNDVNKDKTRLLEVASGLPEDHLKILRSSSGEIKITFFDSDNALLSIDIESFVSPIWSRLEKQAFNDFRHDSNGLVEGLNKDQRVELLNSYTLYDDGTNGSDAYVITPDGIRPSYNPVLCCLRSFGLLEAIKDNILYMATQVITSPLEFADSSVLTTSEVEDLEAILQAKIDELVIKADESIGFTQDITYDFYKKMKWYSNQSDMDNYGPTQ